MAVGEGKVLFDGNLSSAVYYLASPSPALVTLLPQASPPLPLLTHPVVSLELFSSKDARFLLAATTAAFAQTTTTTSAAAGQTYVITVGHNTTSNASLVFQPQEVHAELGDTVLFNFTDGNHTAIQSTFSEPCIPAHQTNITINGFDSGFRDAGNGTAITILSVPILAENVNTTMWFFDWNTCAEGGVGVINANDSSTETLAGFERNALRLNGTGYATSTSASATSTPSSGGANGGGSSASPSTTSTTSSAGRNAALGGLAVAPLLLAAFSL
ncbi:uncharacterized protein FIBRA_06073 [Fibroporia radiculosa]|uniref:Uncharacterized protein n=1 Tax=Fibroporia radiculosa TaxID=599839 RepID=J4HYJ8_9APHY|nr:uncharacterized protein FIBRA_06073 [Fibroporia radiculosa]CCM03922.1 predicted protein [Fibroporia radiculosa]